MTNFDKVQFCDIDQDHQGQRIDNFLFTFLKGVPKSRVYRILRKGEVRVNKKRVKAEYKLGYGDKVRIPPIRVAEKEQQLDLSKFDRVKSLESNIIYETKQFLLLNKPSGIAVHGGSGLSFGIIEALRALRPREKFLELVHRLDRDTSGCLLIAKRRSYLIHFQDQLRYKTMRKEYLALVSGDWDNANNRIIEPLYKNKLKSGERIVRVSEEGKPSETHFKCLKRFDTEKGDFSLIKALPKTGRTHQIRVHAQFAGCPLIGDEKYSDLDADSEVLQRLNLKTFLLHAQKLTFSTPDEEEPKTYEAPLPALFEQSINRLSKQ
ncbi:23S rRNA pseudouridine(955/2504/2580) synthase RluC [Aliikangiella marina]|uniref:Pseudouridine synthase n=1 Tax=Aliikangiella marina TaxID=1712262 RepID=A0A545TJT4_9GAMM|nr:23S rRNA pseudouridine(955/2504/2580) synthase RluC [Aliikangiella marina]TQV77446.1 23S rRNA pseudouridine(955/2504/2580) synthase RluC [Aliikangiella marina]